MSSNAQPVSTDNNKNDNKDTSAHTAPKKTEKAPTWDEIVQTKTKVSSKPQFKREQVRRICLFEPNSISTEKIVENSKNYAFIGKLSCVEHMGKEMSQAMLQRRKESGETDIWADRWGLRWLLRWQYVSLLGRGNIKAFQNLHEKYPIVAQALAEGILVSNKAEMKRAFKAVPMDKQLPEWAGGSLAFFKRAFEPGVRMSKLYVETWKSGSQLAMFGKVWDNFADMGAFKVAARAVHTLAKNMDKEDENTS
ncbi:hypothetical protein GGI25_005284 [Coemansia spiralis]|uniref:Uncharacterized protein n=2 Tax=Coemansia TaxID=4863 RepID=A0A9W8G3H3_9FUNG|nr:hypothetical protein EDC05_005255 [Coemansia umbellata]KAJ2619770.1 hypothetical protein GGI26_005580 [Coemansia sp. RSA 1358]KAJ2671941.1 hypothetical protein GGI25_005284 [Coemansia spiralis]